MSKRISVLSEEVANQIAAGEVVERPASIVKELVENALDAGAGDIRIELVRGGCESIRVADNGSGILRDDVALVFERHATSKISRIDDLGRIGSFGFRGEAMASIASVARVELLSRRPEDLAGTKACVEAGFISEIAPAGLPPGTQVTITKLFANVPARRKFLKTEATEQGACLDAVTRLALVHPHVRFSVVADGREVFAAPAANDVSRRIAMVLGQDFVGRSREIGGQRGQVRLRGFVSTPDFTRSNAKSIFLYVNSRFIRDASLGHAVLAAYRQVIEPRRYPAAVLFLDLPGEDVDVNVHPAKLEVRFKNSREIYDLVATTVAQGLAAARTAPDAVAYRLAPRETRSAASGFWKPKETGSLRERPDEAYSRRNLQQALETDWLRRSEKTFPSSGPAAATSDTQKITFADRGYLGQFAGTYLAFGGPDGLTLVDQHAAHERIILERLKASASRAASQPLLLPEVVSLPPAQIALFADALDLLGDIGLELEIFGRDALVVKALPADLSRVPTADLVSDLADQLAGEAKLSLACRKEKILASLACRAAIKANTALCGDEVAALCRDLEQTPFNATCPHGRPVSVHFSVYEIEKLFKRK
ncbi:MAG: DNA mismatch repair endonuclease MutL [Smithellaceae bacterium]|nr:DNA mismatch repair endonuclease MutL [Smithellaceae bacterium]